MDFIVKDGLKVSELVQVCWKLRDEKTRTREIMALVKAMTELNLKEGLIITTIICKHGHDAGIGEI